MFHRLAHHMHGRRRAHDGFGHAEHHEHRHRGGGRGGRMFDHGDLRLVILQLIAERPRHGYELIKAIEEQLAGAYSPSPGVVYPTLTMLEEQGFAVISATDGSRKLYTATEEGRAHLAANAASLGAIAARIAETGDSAGNTMPILRAVHNLKTALRMRRARGGLTPDHIGRITAAIDAAAREIEQT